VDAILQATARILVRDGYDHASTNRVAEEAGVSVGSLYQYFPSKEALVATLIERHMAEMWAVCQEHLGAPSPATPLPLVVRRLVRAVLRAKAVDPKLHRVFIEQVPRIGRMQKAHGELDRTLAALVRAQLDRRRDEILPRDLDLAAFVLVTVVRSLTFAAVVERPEALDGDDLAEEISALVLRYLCGNG
jgi:AcrR family transcriptional regulator